MPLKKSKIKNITKMDDFDNEYVYDIGMENRQHPWFFGNNILLHNSVYFSVDNLIPEGEFEFTKQNVIDLYDSIAERVNETFADYFLESFNVKKKNCVIKAGREVVASKGLFIKKKRYALLVYDKEGKRKDTDDKPGDIKAMGLDLKRADTSARVQKFLEKVLTMVLCGNTHIEINSYIQQFREDFRAQPAWERGTPKKVNNLSKYKQMLEENSTSAKSLKTLETVRKKLANVKGTKEKLKLQRRITALSKVTIPGHVQASLNYNMLKGLNGDRFSMSIMDGQKVIVCKLKQPNRFQMNSVAYPIDEANIPDWFKELPFDTEEMETAQIDKKLKNFLDVLKWNIADTRKDTSFDDIFG